MRQSSDTATMPQCIESENLLFGFWWDYCKCQSAVHQNGAPGSRSRVVSKSFAISVQHGAHTAGWGQLAAACERSMQ